MTEIVSPDDIIENARIVAAKFGVAYSRERRDKMNNYCVSCGARIPDGQRTCSMCYGDPYHGRDGYYLQWMEEQERQEQARRQEPSESAEKILEG